MLRSEIFLINYFFLHYILLLFISSAIFSAFFRISFNFNKIYFNFKLYKIYRIFLKVFYVYFSILLLFSAFLFFQIYFSHYIIFDYALFDNYINLNYFYIKNSAIYSIKGYNLLSLTLFFLALIVGFISFFALDSRFSKQNSSFLYFYFFFLAFVVLFISTSSYLLFFLYYELLVLPSFFFVYYISYTRKAVLSSLYFVVWTQLGSILVLIAIIYIYILSRANSFSDIVIFNFRQSELFIIYLLFFFGFGFKVPIWPFHYWLTKTHVEAPAGFSIYLSGFLVKSAVYAFFKYTSLLHNDFTFVMGWIFCVVGCIDASIKMWGQSDLKKLIAYCTIQEMNILYLLFLWGDGSATAVGGFFMIMHSCLSGLMFFLVDCIFRRFMSRSVFIVGGILNYYPQLSLYIFCMILFFSGIPGTAKFVIEFWIYTYLYGISWFLAIFVLFSVNFLGLIGFSKVWFNSLFGLSPSSFFIAKGDLSSREIWIIFIFIFLLLFSPLLYFFS